MPLQLIIILELRWIELAPQQQCPNFGLWPELLAENQFSAIFYAWMAFIFFIPFLRWKRSNLKDHQNCVKRRSLFITDWYLICPNLYIGLAVGGKSSDHIFLPLHLKNWAHLYIGQLQFTYSTSDFILFTVPAHSHVSDIQRRTGAGKIGGVHT